MIYKIIILSFVVQNFYSNHFLIKTYKYKSLTLLNNISLLYTLSKRTITLVSNSSFRLFNTPFTFSLYNYYFATTFWKNFKNTFSKKLGTVVSNLTKTSYYLFYKTLLSRFDYKPCGNKYTISNLNLTYLQPNTLIPFNFHTHVYNTLMFYFISLINTFYVPVHTEFKLYYSFIWRNPNLMNYDFLNRFYFRLKNY